MRCYVGAFCLAGGHCAAQRRAALRPDLRGFVRNCYDVLNTKALEVSGVLRCFACCQRRGTCNVPKQSRQPGGARAAALTHRCAVLVQALLVQALLAGS
jgi:hypothetical protein